MVTDLQDDERDKRQRKTFKRFEDAPDSFWKKRPEESK